SLKKSSTVTFIGLVTKKRQKLTKKNEAMAFLEAEDGSGEAELIAFPSLYAASGDLIEEGRVLVFTGNPELKEVYGEEGAEVLTILLKSVSSPEDAMKNAPPLKEAEFEGPSLYIKVTAENEFHFNDALNLASNTNGKNRILVYFEKEKRLAAAKGRSCNITERLVRQLKALMGDANIAVK
ncbi:MAG: hypothetical protein J6R49_03585, partial [Clostridia bacterium]|nr:hypothetical protein [Clostridia bacterium]